MIEDRLVELETRLAFQEDSLQELNQVLCRQQVQLDQLERMVSALVGRVQELQASQDRAKGVAEERPPHY